MVTEWPWMTFHRPCLPMARLHSQRKRRPTGRLTQHVAPMTPVSSHMETMSEIHFNTFIQIYLIEAAYFNHKQLHRKSQMQTVKTLHPPVTPLPPRVTTQWIRHQTASSCLWILLARRSKMRPTTHVRPLKDPDWCLTQYSRCWATLTSAFLLRFLLVVCASDPFIEINLEDAMQSEPSTTTPENPSSVLPFSSSLTSSLA